MATTDPHAGSERETLYEAGARAAYEHTFRGLHGVPSWDTLRLELRESCLETAQVTIDAALLAAPSPSEERAATLEQAMEESWYDWTTGEYVLPGFRLKADSEATVWDALRRALAPASPSQSNLERLAAIEDAFNEGYAHGMAASPSAEPPRNNAWLALKHRSNLKQCPWCGELALEGEVECSECGARPTDDTTWRNDPAPLVQPEPQPEDTP